MEDKGNKTRIWASPHLWLVPVITASCSLLYYLTPITDLIGWTFPVRLYSLHNFAGLDFYALVFLVPVVYAIFFIGVRGAALTALTCMLLLFPYSHL